MEKIDFVIGSAGTGKTTWIENKITELEQQGLRWTYLTYSASMANEARTRIGRDNRNIGTFHSIISRYKHLYNFFSYRKKDQGVQFAKMMGLSYYGKPTVLDDENKDDFGKFLSAYSYMYNTLSDHMPADVSGRLNMEFLREKYDAFKARLDMMDYNDILIQGLTGMPHYDVVLVDESQDLTPLLWKIIANWDVEQCYVVGDPYQSIYTFLGSSIKTFMENFKKANSVVYLNKSYRFGDNVKQLSKSVVKNISTIPIDYDAQGNTTIKHSTSLSEFSRLDGTKAILTRTNRLAKTLCEQVEPNLPINFEHYHNTPYDHKTIRLTNIMHDYPNIGVNDIAYLVENIPTSMLKRGIKTRAIEKRLTLDDFRSGIFKTEEEKGNIIENLALTQDKKKIILKSYTYGINMNDVIYIDTIHASKGMEFDNVMLLTDKPSQLQQNADESCVIYTGITRVKNRLYYGYMGLENSSYVVG